ncbi:MAG: DUF2065 domain-containing protein [Rhodospirillaceae bacterium]|nr:DUF2065 domain-containing protein [Rhodospirillaceae bacterium]MDD9918724.1 DUF2065 domain-containing protein [Rhodospirillaceae bacterium]MDD9929097.1 DUF2065 domain-containing protein [Rhodospirillaceae bacterium]
MADFATALALVLVIEGLLYALFPEAMQRMMRIALEAPPTVLRNGGLAAAILGFIVVWLIRG